jgi:hypothetical protein
MDTQYFATAMLWSFIDRGGKGGKATGLRKQGFYSEVHFLGVGVCTHLIDVNMSKDRQIYNSATAIIYSSLPRILR